MVATELLAFVRSNCPHRGAPARGLRRRLRARPSACGSRLCGLAIDPEPAGAAVRPLALHELDEPAASSEAAVAITSLHHVERLEDSLGRLAQFLASAPPRGGCCSGTRSEPQSKPAL